MIKNYSKVASSFDHAAKDIILEKIETILPYTNEEVNGYEVFLKVEDLLYANGLWRCGWFTFHRNRM
jgi:hypothetical protein